MSDSLGPHRQHHARLLCPSLSPGVCSNYGHWVNDAIQPSHPLWPAKKKNEYLPLSCSGLSAFCLFSTALTKIFCLCCQNLGSLCTDDKQKIWRQLWRREEWLYFFGRQRGSTLRTVLLSLENSIVYSVCCSVVSDSATPWIMTCQDPLSMGVLQARIPEWLTISSSRGSSQPRNRTQVFCLVGGLFTIWATRGALENGRG